MNITLEQECDWEIGYLYDSAFLEIFSRSGVTLIIGKVHVKLEFKPRAKETRDQVQRKVNMVVEAKPTGEHVQTASKFPLMTWR